MGNKRIRINLTGVGSVIVEQKDKKVDSITRCDNGLTMEQYQDLNIPYDKIPQEIKDKEKLQDTEELETEEVYSDVIIYEDQIKLIINDDEGYTTIFLEDGIMVEVVETALEIDTYLDYIQMSWLDKRISVFKSFLRKIKWKLSKENKKIQDLTEV